MGNKELNLCLSWIKNKSFSSIYDSSMQYDLIKYINKLKNIYENITNKIDELEENLCTSDDEMTNYTEYEVIKLEISVLKEIINKKY